MRLVLLFLGLFHLLVFFADFRLVWTTVLLGLFLLLVIRHLEIEGRDLYLWCNYFLSGCLLLALLGLHLLLYGCFCCRFIFIVLSLALGLLLLLIVV